MDSIKITTGEKRIAINGDLDRIIVFNPNDVIFAEKFYALLNELETVLPKYQARSEVLDKNKETDTHGLPVDLGERIALLREGHEYIRGRIDHLFGAGTSQKAFGDALELEVFEQFLTGIIPFIQTARAQKVAQYSSKKPKRVMR